MHLLHDVWYYTIMLPIVSNALFVLGIATVAIVGAVFFWKQVPGE